MPAPIHVLQAVRRYGPVGGMERYVWEVTRELAARGHRVEVVCERCHAPLPAGIEVHQLGEILQRPRWLALLRFGWRVARWLRANPRPGAVIHSSERLDMHDVTTFHGPPFATVRDRAWWRRVSLRVAMQFRLERRELERARLIVPNSQFIRKQLAHYYPEYAGKLTEPIAPGVTPIAPRAWKVAPPAGGIVGFVGKEWERKGLPLAVEIVKRLRAERPDLELWVAGPEAAEVQDLFEGWQGGYKLLGWRSDAEHLRQMDVLLHPARAEPFGMVITEAMAAQARVVVSEVCGAAQEVKPGSGVVVALDATLDYWVAVVRAQLVADRAPPVYARGWRDVALEHEALYRRLQGR
jgi:UDP-glucose:(heptosyl)LPS alpha-1,3-glucosyltransferase